MTNHHFLVPGIILMLISCNDENVVFHGCCNNAPVSERVGNAVIYLPNLFTPNDDKVNDWCYLLGDSIANISSFEVRDRKGNIVFQANNIQANDPEAGWEGKVNGTIQKGLYSVSFTVQALDGTLGSFESSVCNYPCGQIEADELISIDGCHFASEWDCHSCQYHEFQGCFK